MLTPDNLRPWQKAAAGVLAANDNHLLGAQPGSGKTVTTLTACAAKPKRTLLVAPSIILETVWAQEAGRWSHTKHFTFDFAHRYSGGDRARLWMGGTGDFVTCTPDTLAKLLKQIESTGVVPFARIVCDEGHMMKSPEGLRGQALRALAEVVPTWVLSGTLTPNGVIDSWSPGRIASKGDAFWDANFYAWRGRHFTQKSEFTWRPKNKAVEERIRAEFAKHACAIKLEDSGGGVPEPFYTTHPFSWDEAHFERIRSFEETGEVVLPNGLVRTAESEGSYLAILRQLTSGLIYVDGGGSMLSEARIEAVADVIDDVEGPVIVPVFYKAEVAALLKRFRGSVAFTGATLPSERARIINDFNADKIPVLIAAPAAMGMGVNLQHGSAKTIIWHTNSFDFAQREQMNARLVRSGQKNHVSIVSIVADAGLDRAVIAVLADKRSGESALMDALDIRNKFKGGLPHAA